MDIEKLNIIRNGSLALELVDKSYSDDFAGVLLHSNSPFELFEYEPPIRAFRALSQKKYPIYFFISPESINDDFKVLLQKYDKIRVITIPTLKNTYDFNNFSINNLLYYIDPKHENLFFVQFDGWIIKEGFEEIVSGYSWIGAKWREPLQIVENIFNFPEIWVGNGGSNFRKRSKCLEVLDLVNKHGGQQKIVQGLKINGELRRPGWFLSEDSFFCHFGFGAGIFEPVDLDWIDSVALEPIPFDIYNNLDKRSTFFHRIDF